MSDDNTEREIARRMALADLNLAREKARKLYEAWKAAERVFWAADKAEREAEERVRALS